jgi:hypothetical protein
MKEEWRVVAIFNVILFIILVSPAVVESYANPDSIVAPYFLCCCWLVVRVLRRLLCTAKRWRKQHKSSWKIDGNTSRRLAIVSFPISCNIFPSSSFDEGMILFVAIVV